MVQRLPVVQNSCGPPLDLDFSSGFRLQFRRLFEIWKDILNIIQSWEKLSDDLFLYVQETCNVALRAAEAFAKRDHEIEDNIPSFIGVSRGPVDVVSPLSSLGLPQLHCVSRSTACLKSLESTFDKFLLYVGKYSGLLDVVFNDPTYVAVRSPSLHMVAMNYVNSLMAIFREDFLLFAEIVKKLHSSSMMVTPDTNLPSLRRHSTAILSSLLYRPNLHYFKVFTEQFSELFQAETIIGASIMKQWSKKGHQSKRNTALEQFLMDERAFHSRGLLQS